MPDQEFDQDMPFPSRGIDLSGGFEQQAPGTTPVGLNVLNWDYATGRLRGAQRPGLSKYIAGQVNGSASIQEINSLVMTSGTLPGSQAFSQIGAAFGNTLDLSGGVFGSPVSSNGFIMALGGASSNLPVTTGHTLVVLMATLPRVLTLVDDAGNTYTRAVEHQSHIDWTSVWYKIGVAGSPRKLGGTVSGGTGTDTFHFLCMESPYITDVDGTAFLDVPATVGDNFTHETLGPLTPSFSPGLALFMMRRDEVGLYPLNNVETGQGFTLLRDFNSSIAFETNTLWLDRFQFYGSAAPITLDLVQVGPIDPPVPRILTATMVAFKMGGAALPKASAQAMTTAPTEVLVAVAGGTPKVAVASTWAAITNGASALSTTAPVIRSAVNNGKLWFADGATWKYYDPSINTMVAWTATKGSLPGSNLSPVDYPRLIATWRGRMVVSGLKLDPRNWFMSAVSDPQNWDTAPLPIVGTQAILGNDSPLGLVGDIITCLIAYTDDVLLIGGDHTIWIMNGDPMAGGQINLVTDSIGMAMGQPWCKAPDGTVYFVSNLTGIFQLVPNQGPPQRISQQINQLLYAYDPASIVFRMMWDDIIQGLYVFCTAFSAQAGSAAFHFFWEQRTNAWWEIQFASPAYDPKCCYTYAGNSVADRSCLVGSWDGYVRQLRRNTPQDDGNAISSAVVIGPLTSKGLDDFLAKDIQAILGVGSGTVTFSVYVGASAELALSSTAVATGTWTAGRSYNMPIRRSGHGIYVKLTATSYWAMEAIRLREVGLGKVRKRGK